MENKKILLADDEAALRFLLTETLADEGYDVSEAEDGQEAMQKIEQEKYSVIILDYMMPEKTGIEVCHWLRQNDNPNRETPVILLTAKAQEKDRERAKEVGVTTYIIKPFSPFLLLDVIESYVK